LEAPVALPGPPAKCGGGARCPSEGDERVDIKGMEGKGWEGYCAVPNFS